MSQRSLYLTQHSVTFIYDATGEKSNDANGERDKALFQHTLSLEFAVQKL